jgi:hypothetical protein
MSRFKSRLLESRAPRAIDLRPRMARAVDTLSALREANCADTLMEIALRVEQSDVASLRCLSASTGLTT